MVGSSKNRDRVIVKIRLGDLNKFYAERYRGRREDYVFTDDDAGLEDLKILLHHYAINNPLAMPRILKLRAPWADAQKILEENETYPQVELQNAGPDSALHCGRMKRLRLRTITPIDMTKEERRQNSPIRNRLTLRSERGGAPR